MSIVLKASVDPAEPLLHHRKALIRSERERVEGGVDICTISALMSTPFPDNGLFQPIRNAGGLLP